LSRAAAELVDAAMVGLLRVINKFQTVFEPPRPPPPMRPPLPRATRRHSSGALTTPARLSSAPQQQPVPSL